MRTIALVLALAISSAALADPIEIPLDQIWGFDIPGTRDIAGIPLPEVEQQQPGLNSYATLRNQREAWIEQFRQALAAKRSTDPAQPALVLPGPPSFQSLSRLAMYGSTMTKQPQKFGSLRMGSHRAGQELTLVIFSHPASYYFRLRRVERDERIISVTYQYEPHATIESTVHFALIPLGALPAGEYRVRFEHLPFEQKYHDAGFLRANPSSPALVSQTTPFIVWDPPAPDVPDPAATKIEPSEIWAYRIPGTRDVRELDNRLSPDMSPREQERTSLVRQIDRALSMQPEVPGPGFVVAGAGLPALEQARDVLTGASAAPVALAPNDDATLVFFTHRTGTVVLDRVERNGTAIKIKYHLRFSGRDGGVHFALIPLGQLPAGKYDVTPVQLPTDGAEPDPQRILRAISRSFSFDVAEPRPLGP